MKIKSLLLLAISLTAVPGMVFAQDAGSILRNYRDSLLRAPGPAPRGEPQVEEVPATPREVDEPVVEGPAVHVEAINVVGNTTLSEDALNEVLAPYIGRPLSTAEIHRAADALMRAIRAAGAFAAKVYILPQDVVDNTVTFNVIEGHLAEDGIVLGRPSSRVDDDVILKQLTHTLEPGTTIDAETGVARPQPGQTVEVYDALKAGAYRYEDAQGLKNDTFHLIVLGFREP